MVERDFSDLSTSSVSSFKTTMSLDSSEPKPSDVGIVVEKEGLHLSSLLTLLNELECLQEHDNRYVSRETKTLFGGLKDVL